MDSGPKPYRDHAPRSPRTLALAVFVLASSFAKELPRWSRGNWEPLPLTYGERAVPDRIQSSSPKWEIRRAAQSGRRSSCCGWAAGWEPGVLARISAPLFPWRGLQPNLQYANTVQTAWVSLKSASVKNKLRFNPFIENILCLGGKNEYNRVKARKDSPLLSTSIIYRIWGPGLLVNCRWKCWRQNAGSTPSSCTCLHPLAAFNFAYKMGKLTLWESPSF